MKTHVRQHYIPQQILKRFCREVNKDNDDILYVFNNFAFDIERVRVSDAYMVENLYDSIQFSDIKQLEKYLGTYLEAKIAPLFKRLVESDSQFTINRDELKLIKKYLLIQTYRSETNMTYYLQQNINGKIVLSDKSKNPKESSLDFWKREMYTIIHSEWDYLVSTECKIETIRHFTSEINQSHLCFYKTDNEEFIINDLGKVSEMLPMEIPKEFHKQYLKVAEHLSKTRLSKALEIAKYELKNKTTKLETFMFFPVSPNFGITVARKHNFGLVETNHYENSITLNRNRFLPPRNVYINKEVYDVNKKILSLRNDKPTQGLYNNLNLLYKQKQDLLVSDDKFLYSIQNLDKYEVIRLNCLMLNESRKYISFKNPLLICDSIKSFNIMYNESVENIKNNYNGLVKLLKNIKKVEL